MGGTAAFNTALIINAAIASIVLLLFSHYRRKNAKVFEPRRLLIKDNPPKPCGDGFFDWVFTTLRLTDDEVFGQCGVDGVMYTLYFKTGLKIMLWFAVYGLAVLIPVYVTSDNCLEFDEVIKTQCIDKVGGLDQLSLSNIPEKSDRMWATMISVYLFAPFALYQLYQLYVTFIHYRLKYLQQLHPNMYAVLVRDIPEEFSTADKLKAKFSEMYDDVVSAVMAEDHSSLEKLLNKRQALEWKLEHVQAVNEQNPEKRAMAKKGGFLCLGGQKVDAEEHWTEEINKQTDLCEKQLGFDKSKDYISTAGFVLFSSQGSAAIAMQSMQVPSLFQWNITEAPESRDVMWTNLPMTFWKRFIRTILIGFATLALVIFWAIPVTFVAALTTLEALSEQAPWIEDIVGVSSVLKGFLEGFLPTLALLIFFIILPMICIALAKNEGLPAISWIHASALKKLYLFYVVNVFFVSLFAGSILGSISDITIDALGASVPKTGVFFTTYLMIQALSLFPLQLLRIGPMIVSWAKLKWLAKTEREKELAWAPGPFNYIAAIPRELLVTLIAATYASVSPIIIPFAIIFFGLGYLRARYLLYWVHIPVYESGGKFFPMMFNRAMFGVVVYEIVVLAVLGVKKSAIAAPLIAPLVVVTCIFWKFANTRFERVASFPPREIYVKAEKGSQLDPAEYEHPALKVDLQPMVTASV